MIHVPMARSPTFSGLTTGNLVIYRPVNGSFAKHGPEICDSVKYERHGYVGPSVAGGDSPRGDGEFRDTGHPEHLQCSPLADGAVAGSWIELSVLLPYSTTLRYVSTFLLVAPVQIDTLIANLHSARQKLS